MSSPGRGESNSPRLNISDVAQRLVDRERSAGDCWTWSVLVSIGPDERSIALAELGQSLGEIGRRPRTVITLPGESLGVGHASGCTDQGLLFAQGMP